MWFRKAFIIDRINLSFYRSCTRHKLGYRVMYKFFCLLAVAFMMLFSSCGSSNPKTDIVELNELEGYFEIIDWDIQADVDSTKLDQLDKVNGKMTMKLKRLGKNSLQVSDILSAKIGVLVPESTFYVFKADVTSQIKHFLEIDKGEEVEFKFPFTAQSVYDEPAQKAFYKALMGDASVMEKIEFDVYTVEEKEKEEKEWEKLEKEFETMEKTGSWVNDALDLSDSFKNEEE